MATNFVKASFQEIYDLHTTAGSSTILGVHTPISTRVHQYLHGFFEQYKQFKYDGCSMVFIPVSQLPVDPLQVGTEAGYVDPRDLVNPILHCGMHGESLGNTLESMFNLDINKSIYDGLDVLQRDDAPITDTDAAHMEQMYYTALASPSFQKAHVQKGFRKGRLVPLSYQMQTSKQLMPFYEGQTDYMYFGGNHPDVSTEPAGPNDNFREGYGLDVLRTGTGNVTNMNNAYGSTSSSNATLQIAGMVGGNSDAGFVRYNPDVFSGNLRRLGWLDTLQSSVETGLEGTSGTITEARFGSRWTALPKLYMYLVMLPPCYMQKMYFRVVLTHHYSFRNFRASKGPFAMESWSVQSYNGPALIGKQVTPDLGSHFEPAMVSDTLNVVNGEASLITDGVS